MIEINEISIESLDRMVKYFLLNYKDIKVFLSDFGEVWKDNGIGTLFLKPKNPIFKFFYLVCKDNEVQRIGFGGPHLGLTLKEFYSVYSHFNIGFNRFDDEYIYVFFKNSDYDHSIRITSKSKIVFDDKLLQQIEVNELEISRITATNYVE